MRIVSFNDFVDMPRANVNWIVESLIPRPGIIELMGPPKTGKSFIALDLAFKVARGESFMGKMTRQAKTLYFQLDTSEHVMRDRGHKLRLAGYDTKAPLLGMVHPADTMRPVNIMFRTGEAYFQQAIALHDPELVIIDTLRECHQEDENDSTAMKQVMDKLEHLFLTRTLFIVHHTSKLSSDVEKPDPVSASRGSSYITGKVDAFWLLYKQCLQIKSRWDDPLEYKAIQRNSGMFSFTDLHPVMQRPAIA